MNHVSKNLSASERRLDQADAYLPVDALRPSKTNPRKTFDPAFIAEMAVSMRQDGVLTALLVRPAKQREIGAAVPLLTVYEIVSGEQRYRAAKDAGLVSVPALVRDLTDDQVANIQIVENLKRRDLTALEEADGYNHMLKSGAKVEQVAERIGRSAEYVYARLRLMSLVPEVRELLLTKRIELGHAIALAALSPADQRRTIRENDGGLWEMQRSMWVPEELRTEEEKRAGRQTRSDDSYKAVSVKELQAWIDDRVKFRADAPVNLQLFPETVANLAKAEESKKKVVHITFEHQVHPDAKDEKGPRVYSAVSWKRADGKGKAKACEHSALGVIDVGPGRGQSFLVCVDRKNCLVHFGEAVRARKAREKEVAAAVTRSGATGEERAQVAEDKAAEIRRRDQAKQKQREEAADRFARALPAIRLQLVNNLAKMPSTPTGILGKHLIANSIDRFDVDSADAKAMPQGKTAEDLVRYVVFLSLTDELRYEDQEVVSSKLKAFGVNVDKIVETANANEAASKAAKKKPAKKAKK